MGPPKPSVPRRRTVRHRRSAGMPNCIERRSESAGKLFRRAFSPIVQEDDGWLCGGHVVMNGDDIETVAPQGLQHRSHFSVKHGHVPGYNGVILASGKCRPGIQAHPDIDGRAHFFYGEVVASNGDFIHRTRLLALVAGNFCEFGGVERRLRRQCFCGGRTRRQRAGVAN